MIKILKESLIWFFPFFIFILIMFAVNIVVKDFKYAHSSHMVWKEPYNWFPYYSTKPLNNFIIKITDNKKVFLPQIH